MLRPTTTRKLSVKLLEDPAILKSCAKSTALNLRWLRFSWLATPSTSVSPRDISTNHRRLQP